jgi:hypothetical protein
LISGKIGQRNNLKQSIPHHTITYIILLGYSALSDPISDTPPSETEVDQDLDANKTVFSRTAYERRSASRDYTMKL